jgi:energy-coupling factor transport system permease protein
MTDRTAVIRTPLDTLNPLVSVVVIAIIAVAMLSSVHPIAPAIVLLAELPLIVVARLSLRAWLIRGVPLVLMLAGIMITNLLFTDVRTGATVLQVADLQVTTGGIAATAAVAFRLLVLAIPGIVLLARIDPTDVSDALITHWRANPRLAVGSLAAMRMAPLVFADLRQSYAARRTRGVVSRSPLVAVPTLFGTMSSVMVTAIRRATRLSLAMDSRGFDSGVQRTLARRSLWRRRDWLVVIGYLVTGLLAVILASLLR